MAKILSHWCNNGVQRLDSRFQTKHNFQKMFCFDDSKAYFRGLNDTHYITGDQDMTRYTLLHTREADQQRIV